MTTRRNFIKQAGIDLVYICTPWDMHAPMALYAMEHGKHAAVEVPAAQTVDECWQLVETSERTGKYCMMLENCCYDFFEMLTLNMARQGFFGDLVHVEGAYLHSRIYMISGTKGIVQKYPLPGRIAVSHEWMNEEEMKKVEDQYTPELIRRIGKTAEEVGGHGGMDFLTEVI